MRTAANTPGKPATVNSATAAGLDHLVVLASSLAEGVAWCEATLGVTPGPGGEHPLMGTHNRLMRIDTVTFPQAYLEIIAINPATTKASTRLGARWFDMDAPALHERVARDGPRLMHWVARVTDVRAAVRALTAQGIDRGAVIAASRPTPAGLLQWQITVRDDGQRLLDGCLPTLIQWGDTHPAATMADSGLKLLSLDLQHPQATRLRSACEAVGLHTQAHAGFTVTQGAATLTATLQTPKGVVQLSS